MIIRGSKFGYGYETRIVRGLRSLALFIYQTEPPNLTSKLGVRILVLIIYPLTEF